jgi:1,4-alpha-glucan branching enzyme
MEDNSSGLLERPVTERSRPAPPRRPAVGHRGDRPEADGDGVAAGVQTSTLVINYTEDDGASPSLRLRYWEMCPCEHPDDVVPQVIDGNNLRFEVQTRLPIKLKFIQPLEQARCESDPSAFFIPVSSDAEGKAIFEFWFNPKKQFFYPEPPAVAVERAEDFLNTLSFKSGSYVPGTGGLSGLGATPLTNGKVLFGYYHPNAAKVFVMGEFNDWQRPSLPAAELDPAKLLPMTRYRGWFGEDIWLLVVDGVDVGNQYKFYVSGGVPHDEQRRPKQDYPDPYARQVSTHVRFLNSIYVDPTTFNWQTANWRTPDIRDLILYELSAYAFTATAADVTEGNRGKFAGITERIEAGYFNKLGVNALSFMPLKDAGSPQGPCTLGYDPSFFMAPEPDLGTPDDLRRLIDAAHANGISVVLDMVFNHTSNTVNPLWKQILEHANEEYDGAEGGLYFDKRGTPWGNRVATDKTDVQNFCIDACKLWMKEYRVDGFRFDATSQEYMDDGFRFRLRTELKGFNDRVVLIAENLPNEERLSVNGFNGFAQWSDPFHDGLADLLAERPNSAPELGRMFFFAKKDQVNNPGGFAYHTNNVVNYGRSHDEDSIGGSLREIAGLQNADERAKRTSMSVGDLLNEATLERKTRLSIFATTVALGQPMFFMGEEFFDTKLARHMRMAWPQVNAGDTLAAALDANEAFQWTSGLLKLRRRYPGLRMFGDNPALGGQFSFILGRWMGPRQGGGNQVIGWRARPNHLADDALVVLMNFQGYPVEVDLDLGIPGRWVRLAYIDEITDLPLNPGLALGRSTTLRSQDGRFNGFVLPSSSGFIYKWQSPP